ncbi:MAG TPA: glycosyltransferase [Acidothermaceae bacterium]|nr:glycosyltransferase [Acidothermaceae bacterium]
MTNDASRRRVTRIIARLNIGGPAIQAITLTRELERYGYETRLVRGVEDPAEGNMDYLAIERGVVPTLVASMRRDPGLGDITALIRLAVLLRRDRPAIVHTHAAKGGTLGRVATFLAYPLRRRRPVVIHTYHGHSLTGYFSGRTAGFYRLVERVLARVTDVLLAVSMEVRDDLVGLHVAPAAQFRVMPVGFDLSPFTADADRATRRAALRAEWSVGDGDLVVTLIARLVSIKRVDRFLAVARLLAARPDVRFVVVGDGELHEELASSDDAVALGERLVWAGFRRDIPDVCFASDVVMLTSDNEGTPVSLIEAQAAAVPVVATDVGGVRSVVYDGEAGSVRSMDDVQELAASVGRLLDDADIRARMGAAGRAHVTTLYTLDRLVADHAALYDELLNARRRARQAPGSATDPPGSSDTLGLGG